MCERMFVEEWVMTSGEAPIATVSDVARYFVLLAAEDGDYITNLKLQKLVYYAYAWTLIHHRRRLFPEPIQAWSNGPVVPVLYQQLKRYGARPIDADEFLEIATPREYEEFVRRFPQEVLETLNGVYEQYMRLTAFDLITLTHNEGPWQKAREGLGPSDRGVTRISDDDILQQFRAA